MSVFMRSFLDFFIYFSGYTFFYFCQGSSPFFITFWSVKSGTNFLELRGLSLTAFVKILEFVLFQGFSYQYSLSCLLLGTKQPFDMVLLASLWEPTILNLVVGKGWVCLIFSGAAQSVSGSLQSSEAMYKIFVLTLLLIIYLTCKYATKFIKLPYYHVWGLTFSIGNSHKMRVLNSTDALVGKNCDRFSHSQIKNKLIFQSGFIIQLSGKPGMSKKGIQLPSFITKLLPNQNDEFHDSSEDDSHAPQPPKPSTTPPLRRTIKITKASKNNHKNNSRLHPQKQTVIEIESDGEIDEESNEGLQSENQKDKFENNLIHLIDLDDEQIQYYKSKLNICPLKEEDCKSANNDESKNSEQKQIKFVPPKDVEKVPKFIYEYPPYPLGPTDTWPPKYPNSWRSFKKQMRECRKLE